MKFRSHAQERCVHGLGTVDRGKEMPHLILALLLANMIPALAAPVAVDAESAAALTTGALERRLVAIDSELNGLASFSMRGGEGSSGYRSTLHPEAAHLEWVEIDLGRETSIDEIVLVPAICRDSKTGFQANAFPAEFRVVVGNAGDREGTTVAAFGAQDRLLPRLGPLVISCPGTAASWVRVEATRLSPLSFNGKFCLMLAELLVFHGEENVALGRPVGTSQEVARSGLELGQARFLVDGFVPYLMDAASGEQSVAFVSTGSLDDRQVITIDLGAEFPLNRIHLHAADLDDVIPRFAPSDFGIPRHLIVEGSNRPDFSDAVPLLDFRMTSPYDAGPTIIRNFPETPCRYVRLTELEPYVLTANNESETWLGFAEIELFSRGVNVAHGKNVSASLGTKAPERSVDAITDGHNLFGEILSTRDWMEQLARRHDLERERPLVAEELSRRYASQKAALERMGWLAALLAGGIVLVILIDRIVRLRQVARIRNRLAADLHDELGADFHSIGLMSDMAERAKDSPAELTTLLQRIRRVTEQSGIAVRHCTNMLAAPGLSTGLKSDMERADRRIMARLDHHSSIEGEDYLDRLNARSRFDLLMFYKECLVNISRHSDATKSSTHLKADENGIVLRVIDNGRGLAANEIDVVPSSLRRRAKLLGAKVTVTAPDSGGTCIQLKLKPRRWLRLLHR